MEDSDFPPHSPRYGNIDELRMAMRASEHEGASSEDHAAQGEADAREGTDSNCVNMSPVKMSVDEIHVIKSQREAMRLKINLMKESSVDEDSPYESNDAEDLEEQSKPKRPSTPLSIQRNAVFTLSSVSIN